MDKVYWQIQKRGLSKILYLGKGTFITTIKGIGIGQGNCYFYLRYNDLYSLYKGKNFLKLSLEEILEKVLLEKPAYLLLGKRKRDFIEICNDSYEALHLNKNYSFSNGDITYTLNIDEY